jgi:phosphopantothenate synthetase
MTNQALFSEVVEFISQSDTRPYDMRLQVSHRCDIWDSGVIETRSFISDEKGEIQTYLIGSEKWSTAHNLSPRDSGVIYGLLLAKWLGWDSTPKSIQA